MNRRYARRPTRGTSFPRLLRYLAAVARLVVVLAAVQLSGLVHATCDVFATSTECAAQREDCPEERQGRDCPPGCPTCHTAHSSLAGMPARFALPERALTFVDLHDFSEADSLHDDPTPPSLFRPPRVPV